MINDDIVILIIIVSIIALFIDLFINDKKPQKRKNLIIGTNRQDVQNKLLEWVDNEIKNKGENAIYCCAPCIGKNSWTLKEYRDAVINDTPMEGCSNNPIDDYINLLKWKQENAL